MRGGMSGVFAYDSFREAMRWYERAEELCEEADNDEAQLRWNTCVRVIRRHNLRARADDEPPMMLE